jgi:DNA-3-methyladenine glycosylase I
MLDGPVKMGDDGRPRCWWGVGDADYEVYHDQEWGFPVADDRLLFEKLCLEGFQSGLSWLTILRKREAFRSAFAAFDFDVVAGFGEPDVERLLGDAGIVRHRGKIEATINNASRAVELVAEAGSLGAFFWSFEPDPDDRVVDSLTPESTAMAKDLKRRGFRFVGPTTCYAFMEAMGIVDDHVHECVIRPEVEAARSAFTRPG